MGDERLDSAALLDEMFSKVQVALVFCSTVQPDEGDLDLLVTRCPLWPSLGEISYQQVSSLDANIQQGGITGDLKMGDRCFDQVTEAVEFVFDLQVLPTKAREMDLVIGVDVTVLRLGTGD